MLGSKPSSTAPRSADADAGELEALIEEARQRARRRRRRYLTAVGLAVVIGAGVYFGLLRDDDGTESSVGAPESQAPGGSLQSGVVEGSVDMGMTGLEGGGSRQRISFSGPFITRTTARLPEFDLAFRMSEPGETPVAFSLISTTEAGYVVYRDSAYQVDSALFERLSSAPVLAELDPARWANAPGVNATKKVAGKNASRKSGRLDVGRMVSDITGAVRDLGIRPGRIEFPQSLFDKAGIDIATTQSGLLRRLAITLTWHGRSSEDAERFKAAMHTRLRITQLNAPQHVQAPVDAVPISTDLTRQLPTQLWGLVEFLSAP